MSTRDRVLDALQRLLVERGPNAVTLEAVAGEAGVSKGGLLYHFSSKKALYAGLVDRLHVQVRDELAEAASSPKGAVRAYLETSLPSEAEADHYWAVIAALRGREVGDDEAVVTLGELFTSWSDLLGSHVDDPVLAETIRLVGDGVYLSAMAGLPPPDPEVLQGVIERLVAAAEEGTPGA